MAEPAAGLRYAVFLRGVNVGGVTLRMADVRDELTGLPVTEVATVLASGNVTCSSSLAPADLKERIEEALRRRFGYEAWVIVVERADLVGIAAAVPEPPGPPGPPGGVHTYVTFFTGRAERDGFLGDAAALAEQPTVLPGGTAISWFSPKGQSTEVPVAKLLARARYASTSTTRNINTVDKVLRLLA